jgi:5'-deoxynucleotidase
MTAFLHLLNGPTPLDLLATSHVVRWHTVATTRHQTLADHLGKVALLADHLGNHLGGRYTPEVALETLRKGLNHDLPETEHGDIPAPAKGWLNKALGSRYDDQVATAWWDARRMDVPKPSQLAEDLVAVADILEACAWYWTFGLTAQRGDVHDLRSALVFETFNQCKLLLPELVGAVGEILAAAGVPDTLINEAAA